MTFLPLSDVLRSAVADNVRVPVLETVDFSAGCDRPITLKGRKALVLRCERVVVDAIDVSCGWCEPCRDRKARRIITRAAALLVGAQSVRLVTLSPSVEMHLDAEREVRGALLSERDELERRYPDEASLGWAAASVRRRLGLLQQMDLNGAGFIPFSGLSDAAERLLTRRRRKALYPALQRFVKRVRHHHGGAVDVTAVAEKHPGDKPGGSGQLTGHIHFHVLFSVRDGAVIGRKMLKRADGRIERKGRRRLRCRPLRVGEKWLMKISRLRSGTPGDAAAKYLGAARYVSKDTVFAVMSRRMRDGSKELVGKPVAVAESGAAGAAFAAAGRETVPLAHWEAMRLRNNIGEIIYRSWDLARPWVDLRDDAAFDPDEPPF